MTQIDFYLRPEEPLVYAARLTRKAYSLKRKVVILLANSQMQADCDALLWTLGDTDFIPHTGLFHPLAQRTPVVLCHVDEVSDDSLFPHHDLLINLSATMPVQFSGFIRLCEVVEAAGIGAARERYRAYQKRGYPLSSTEVGAQAQS